MLLRSIRKARGQITQQLRIRKRDVTANIYFEAFT